RIDAILVWKMDRWGRSMPHFIASLQELRSLGVRFIATTQGIDTDESNPASKLMLNLLVAFSESGRERIAGGDRAGRARGGGAGGAWPGGGGEGGSPAGRGWWWTGMKWPGWTKTVSPCGRLLKRWRSA